MRNVSPVRFVCKIYLFNVFEPWISQDNEEKYMHGDQMNVETKEGAGGRPHGDEEMNE